MNGTLTLGEGFIKPFREGLLKQLLQTGGQGIGKPHEKLQNPKTSMSWGVVPTPRSEGMWAENNDQILEGETSRGRTNLVGLWIWLRGTPTCGYPAGRVLGTQDPNHTPYSSPPWSLPGAPHWTNPTRTRQWGCHWCNSRKSTTELRERGKGTNGRCPA